jgi:hypothetical protein
MSLAHFQADHERRQEARSAGLAYGRLAEGFGTADVQRAKALLDEIG